MNDTQKNELMPIPVVRWIKQARARTGSNDRMVLLNNICEYMEEKHGYSMEKCLAKYGIKTTGDILRYIDLLLIYEAMPALNKKGD